MYEIHPKAQSAYEFCLSLNRKFNLDELSEGVKKMLDDNLIINVYTDIEKKKYLIISGFESVLFDVDRAEHYRRNVIIKNNADTIESFAWSAVINFLISMPEPKALANVHELLLIHLPKEIKVQFSKTGKFTQQKFSKLSNTASSTLTKQRKNKKKDTISKNPPIQHLSILERALRASCTGQVKQSIILKNCSAQIEE